MPQVFQRWRGTPAKTQAFKTTAFYKSVRHPLYLGFILAFWATPVMTQGHRLFVVATMGYIFAGITLFAGSAEPQLGCLRAKAELGLGVPGFFEERDFIAIFGEEYRRYRQHHGGPRLSCVASAMGLLFGSLGAKVHRDLLGQAGQIPRVLAGAYFAASIAILTACPEIMVFPTPPLTIDP